MIFWRSSVQILSGSAGLVRDIFRSLEMFEQVGVRLPTEMLEGGPSAQSEVLTNHPGPAAEKTASRLLQVSFQVSFIENFIWTLTHCRHLTFLIFHSHTHKHRISCRNVLEPSADLFLDPLSCFGFSSRVCRVEWLLNVLFIYLARGRKI